MTPQGILGNFITTIS